MEKGLVECLNDQLSLNVHNLDDWKPENAWAYLKGPEEHNLLADLPETTKL